MKEIKVVFEESQFAVVIKEKPFLAAELHNEWRTKVIPFVHNIRHSVWFTTTEQWNRRTESSFPTYKFPQAEVSFSLSLSALSLFFLQMQAEWLSPSLHILLHAADGS
jgi:hypothetical protein